uniref:Cytochrome P450 n=1 Tax=Leersia perrieri TaxID=77586 RepID=A0A0D9WBQ1_9ORYZ
MEPWVALVLLLILVASWSWWKMISSSSSCKSRRRSNCEQGDDEAAFPPAGAGAGAGWWWEWRETAWFVAEHGSGRGFYNFVQARYVGTNGSSSCCFRTALFGRVHVFVSAALPGASRVLASDPPHLAKRYARTAADLLGPHSILCCTSHSRHRLLRRALAPLFSLPSTAAFAASFDRRATARLLLAAPAPAGVLLALDAALEISYGAICEMLVAGDSKLAMLQGDVFAVTQAMLALPLRCLPGSRFRRGLHARKRITAAIRDDIIRTRNAPNDHDLLSVLMQRRQAGHPDALTDEQIEDNILTLIIAGQVTTATAITWMLKYLSDNPQIQDKLRAEALGLGLKGDYPLTLQHLNKMDYAYKAVKESLRMATIVSWFPRVALKDCQVAGFHIQKDWIINVDARALHYDPAVFHNPTVFDPSRFNDDEEGEEDGVKKGSAQQRRLLVFGAGGRTCLGMNLAKIMMLIFLHRLVTNFRWEMADDDPSLEKWAMFPRLKNGCPIVLTPINHS